MKKNEMYRAKRSHGVLHARLAPTCFATMMALGMVMPVQAAVIADNTSSNQPAIHTGGNGATIVDINKASADGVSHNIYSKFNVDTNGVILNNSGSASNTQLAGQIDGNANMAGTSATVILNEVRSSDPSQLNGMVEVAGQSAQVIIANPSGITCNGCGFINTSHATLTTGVSTEDSKGNFSGFDVKKGQVVITGKGMDTSSTQYTDIISRSVKVNAQLKANELNIITGSNHVDQNGFVRAITGTGNAPEMALDVSSLGSMYANKIYMKGTEKGVGVNIDHADLTASDSLTIDSQGTINNNGGRIAAANMAQLQSAKDIVNHDGQITSGGMVTVSSENTIDNRKGKIEGGDVSVSGRHSVNNVDGMINGAQSVGIMTADSLDNSNGSLTSNGAVYISSASYNNNNAIVNNWNGNITAGGDISINTGNVNNDEGSIASTGSLNVNAHKFSNNNGDITIGNGNAYTSSMISASELNNNNGRITVQRQHSDLMVSGDNSFTNRNGVISTAGYMFVNGNVDNSAGTLSADKDINIYARSYASDANSMLAAGKNINMNVTDSFQNGGLIKAGQDMALQINQSYTTQPAENTGTIEAANRLSLQKNGSFFDNAGNISAAQLDLSFSDLTNTGFITSTGDININGTNLTNAGAGKITAGNDINAWVSTLNTDTDSQINAGNDANITLMREMHNTGDITASHDINLIAMNNRNSPSDNNGVISAGNNAVVAMGEAFFANLGTIKGDKSVTISGKSVYNDGDISSLGDVIVQANNGITNDVSGKITGATVKTLGNMTNFGEITETSAANSGDNKPDNGNVIPTPVPTPAPAPAPAPVPTP
ncbi:filamentous hemagglutinin N-terminal domain-containing protein, partial [Enterobacter sp. 61D5]